MARFTVCYADGRIFQTDDPHELPPSDALVSRAAEREAVQNKADLDDKVRRAEQDFYCATVRALCEGRGWP